MVSSGFKVTGPRNTFIKVLIQWSWFGIVSGDRFGCLLIPSKYRSRIISSSVNGTKSSWVNSALNNVTLRI